MELVGPFANGELHIGHAASSLPGDIIARYHRLKGNKVILVSGTDCHGTPIEVKALKENLEPKDIVDKCHISFKNDFNKLGISFDLYNRTDDEYHKKFVQDQFKKYYENNYLFEKEERQLYCNNCNMFLADRYIIGICPKCGNEIKGDECEKCGSLLTIDKVKDTNVQFVEIKQPKKQIKIFTLNYPIFKMTSKYFLKIIKIIGEKMLLNLQKRYLKEGIPDRCISRIQKYGISIPITGYENKKLYGWFENVWGYVTASKKYAENNNLNWENFWKNGYDNKIYLVHAKDNIPFHTVIFPSLLLATKENYKLPDVIVSDEYVTIEGEKLSKSKGKLYYDKTFTRQLPSRCH